MQSVLIKNRWKISAFVFALILFGVWLKDYKSPAKLVGKNKYYIDQCLGVPSGGIHIPHDDEVVNIYIYKNYRLLVGFDKNMICRGIKRINGATYGSSEIWDLLDP